MLTHFPFTKGMQNIQGRRNSKKSVSAISGAVTIMFSSLLLAALLPPWGNCAELRPYELPSQKHAPYQQRYDSPAQIPTSGYFDYEAFAARAATLPPEERTKLKQGLEQRLNDALEQKNFREVGHYATLLEIVKNIR